jgi:hypothetical protein
MACLPGNKALLGRGPSENRAHQAARLVTMAGDLLNGGKALSERAMHATYEYESESES